MNNQNHHSLVLETYQPVGLFDPIRHRFVKLTSL
jgi:hypothetical protein